MSEVTTFDAVGLERVRYHFGDRVASLRHPPTHATTTLEQVHGSEVVVVAQPGTEGGRAADALVSDAPGAVLCIRTADCVPLLFAGRSESTGGPVVAVVHAGWRGLYEGVVERAVEVMRGRGATDIEWRIGPCISAAVYEFSPADLTTLALRFGPDVVASTTDGAPALDLHAAARAAAIAAGLDRGDGASPPCTATTLDAAGAPRYYSWRARRDDSRQISSIWIEP